MYLVTIVNNNIETVINHVSINNKANRISGTIKQGINCINSFTFTIYPNNVGYNLIFPIKTKVKVLNTKTNKYEFIGRVLTPSNAMSSSGLISKTFVCESELAYLLDTMQAYEEVHGMSVKDFLNKLIQVHNSKTSEDKQFQLGNVTVIDNNDSLYRYISYDSTKKNIDDDLIDKLGGELQIRYEDDVRYIDYLTEIGKICDTEIRLGKNIKDIINDIDPTNYITRLIPLGAKLKKTEIGEDGTETEVDSEERLTIASVNNGFNCIDDEEAIAEFGIIEGYVNWDDVSDANNLLIKGKNYLASQRIIISNKITALDLSLIGLDIDSFEVGNYYPLKHNLLDIDYNVRIIEKSIDINNPQNASITLGDKQKDIKDYQLSIKKQASKVITLERDVSINAKKLNDANKAIISTSKSIEQVSGEVTNLGSSTNETINKMVESIQLLSEAVININQSLVNINDTLESINVSLTETNEKIIALDERLKILEEVK